MSSTPPGIILVNKPQHISSFYALGPIKKQIGKKVGHTGTLDPFASGLLVVLSGCFTKAASYFTRMSKLYEAVVCFGISTDTLDYTGIITESGACPSHALLSDVIAQFRGASSQVPPQFSAIKVNGVRAYKNARNNRYSHIAPRTIFVEHIALLEYRPPYARLRIRCSSGTYIRALVRDIAHRCGSMAYVSQLVRMAVGRLSVAQAISPLKFHAKHHFSPPQFTHTVADTFHLVNVSHADSVKIRNGVKIDHLACYPQLAEKQYGADELICLLDEHAAFLACCAPDKHRMRYVCVAN